jgi:hypothetical protein
MNTGVEADALDESPEPIRGVLWSSKAAHENGVENSPSPQRHAMKKAGISQNTPSNNTTLTTALI